MTRKQFTTINCKAAFVENKPLQNELGAREGKVLVSFIMGTTVVHGAMSYD